MNDETKYEFTKIALAHAVAEIERLRAALRIIAGYEQCADNLMSNADVARAALSGKGET